MVMVEDRFPKIRDGLLNPKVMTAGEGPPVVFLHGAGGLRWDGFLDDLSSEFTVYAPLHPGLHDPDDIRKIDTLWDLVLYHYDLFDALGLESPAVIGHSYGGMLAAEIAASSPDRVSKLTLMNPIGFWLDDHPVLDWTAMSPDALVKALFSDPDGEFAKGFLQVPEDEEEFQNFTIARTWAIACTSKFTWPIPDKGLKNRIYRVSAPALILWGKQDALVPPEYAKEFSDRMVNTTVRTEILDGAGHIPQLEQREKVTALVKEFLRS